MGTSRASDGLRSIGYTIAALVLGVGSCTYIVDRAATLSSDETQLLEVLAADLADAADVTITTESTDRSPCWWWCEDYVLDIHLYADVTDVRGRDQAEVCTTVGAAFVELLGQPTRDDVGNLHYRECYLAWDIQHQGRTVSVSLDVITEDSLSGPNTHFTLTNRSVQRAFLPQGSWKKE